MIKYILYSDLASALKSTQRCKGLLCGCSFFTLLYKRREYTFTVNFRRYAVKLDTHRGEIGDDYGYDLYHALRGLIDLCAALNVGALSLGGGRGLGSP